jgi:hypothetical protein
LQRPPLPARVTGGSRVDRSKKDWLYRGCLRGRRLKRSVLDWYVRVRAIGPRASNRDLFDPNSGVLSFERRPCKQQRNDFDRKCSVSRMARPQRGTYRFTEEPAPAISIERRATSSIPRLASCHPDRSKLRDPNVAVSFSGRKGRLILSINGSRSECRPSAE